MPDPVATSAIIRELLDTPGQSKFLLASRLQLSPMVLQGTLEELAEEGLVVESKVPGDEEPVFWASEAAVDEGAVESSRPVETGVVQRR